MDELASAAAAAPARPSDLTAARKSLKRKMLEIASKADGVFTKHGLDIQWGKAKAEAERQKDARKEIVKLDHQIEQKRTEISTRTIELNNLLAQQARKVRKLREAYHKAAQDCAEATTEDSESEVLRG